MIVPVYHVEKYLKRCVDSIVGQSYSNLEILLIDDGSTDSSARNAGLEIATGGISSDLNKNDINFLVKNLRQNYRLLMRSSMPRNRKMGVTAFCISYKLTELSFATYRKIKSGILENTEINGDEI